MKDDWFRWASSKEEFERVVNPKKTELDIVEEENVKLKRWLRSLCQKIATHDEFEKLRDRLYHEIVEFLGGNVKK